MTILQSIILGIVQGATEFLPISSSGHLVLIPHLFGWHIPDQDKFVFDVLIQVATLIAVVVYFWDDLFTITKSFFQGIVKGQPFGNPNAQMGWLLGLATVPAGVAYLLFANTFENAFANPLATSLFLFGTALLLLIAEWAGKRDKDFEGITWVDAIIIGFFQILAIFPGISRSGSTITGGMTRNLDRKSAARFSFLISFPVMMAAGLIGVIKLIQLPDSSGQLIVFIPGFITAAIVGYISIRWLLRFLTQRPLYIFAMYCVIFGIINLVSLSIQ
ncbi:MAG: undecaprenyl-diphosphatase UppP [Anaerolineales bacterium]|nr:undecaprenyl-diphosphatase UppP [Chloroflexota bacterium]MBL6980968.1 undecaprenyl-diphosphatase UppP [Anaerolineales bacterium]